MIRRASIFVAATLAIESQAFQYFQAPVGTICTPAAKCSYSYQAAIPSINADGLTTVNATGFCAPNGYCLDAGAKCTTDDECVQYCGTDGICGGVGASCDTEDAFAHNTTANPCADGYSCKLPASGAGSCIVAATAALPTTTAVTLDTATIDTKPSTTLLATTEAIDTTIIPSTKPTATEKPTAVVEDTKVVPTTKSTTAVVDPVTKPATIVDTETTALPIDTSVTKVVPASPAPSTQSVPLSKPAVSKPSHHSEHSKPSAAKPSLPASQPALQAPVAPKPSTTVAPPVVPAAPSADSTASYDDGDWYAGKYDGPGTPYDDGSWSAEKYPKRELPVMRRRAPLAA